MIIFGAIKPPKFFLPLWYIPAPLNGTGSSDSTGCASMNGIVVWAASLSKSVCENSMYWSCWESGIDGDGDLVGMSGFGRSSRFLKQYECYVEYLDQNSLSYYAVSRAKKLIHGVKCVESVCKQFQVLLLLQVHKTEHSMYLQTFRHK